MSLSLPTEEAKMRVKVAAVLLVLLWFGSIPFWNRSVWMFFIILAAALGAFVVWWWFDVENTVNASHNNDIFEGAPPAGILPPSKTREQLIREHITQAPAAKKGDRKRRVCFVRANSGGGHLASMNAVKEMIAAAGLDWDIYELDMPGLLENANENIIQKIFHITGEECYNWCLSMQTPLSSLFARFMSTLAQVLAFLMHSRLMPAGLYITRDEWQRLSKKTGGAPDLVVSFITVLNRVTCDGLELAGMSDVPFCTIVTDFEHSFIHPWLQVPEGWAVCGSKRLVSQALEKGYGDHMLPTTGMVISPKFYDAVAFDRVALHNELKLDPSRRTVLLLYGGCAPNYLFHIGRLAANAGVPINLIFMCGVNKDLLEKLSNAETVAKSFGDTPVHAVGFTREVAKFMAAADAVICKPGPGVVTESAALGIPMLVEYNQATLAQEETVAQYVSREKLGYLWRRRSQVPDLVKRLFKSMGPVPPNQYRRIGHNRPKNVAVFEIPDLLAKVLSIGDSASGRSAQSK